MKIFSYFFAKSVDIRILKLYYSSVNMNKCSYSHYKTNKIGKGERNYAACVCTHRKGFENRQDNDGRKNEETP